LRLHVEARGSAAEMQFLGNDAKVPQVPEFHRQPAAVRTTRR
jgi:hypothetical protein